MAQYKTNNKDNGPKVLGREEHKHGTHTTRLAQVKNETRYITPKRRDKRVRRGRVTKDSCSLSLSFLPDPSSPLRLSLSPSQPLARSHGQKEKGAQSPCLSRLPVPPPYHFSCVPRRLHKATGRHPNDEWTPSPPLVLDLASPAKTTSSLIRSANAESSSVA